MEQTQIDAEKAIEIVKEYFVKIKGANVEVASRKMIDWLDFDVISTNEETDQYLITCELRSNMFSKTKEKYKIIVSKTGKIKEVKRENGSS